MLGFLARTIEHRSNMRGKVRSRLQEQRRLADAGFAAKQHERAWDDPSTEHPVELADSRAEALGDDGVHVRVKLRALTAQRRDRAARHGSSRGGLFFNERVPGAAIRTTAEPLGRLRAAGLAGE